MAGNWRTAYDNDEAIVYLIDADLRIVRCNPAWDRFALANRGEAVLSTKIAGASIMDVVTPQLRDFYLAAYANVRRFRRVWWHVFECSSADLARTFQMRILPCDDGSLLTINTLVSETPLASAPPKPAADYADQDGIVTMCASCRRVLRVRPPAGWDWVPELLLSGQVLSRFGLCEFCAAYHYRDQEVQL
jgi:hypothetical protein